MTTSKGFQEALLKAAKLSDVQRTVARSPQLRAIGPMQACWLAALILPLYTCSLPLAGATRAPKDRPNFIMLFVDDLGYGDVGFTGHPTTQTPNIDKLAMGGKVLTTWYSGCPVCTGSRAALMTGRQYPRSGVAGVFPVATSGGLPLNETTVAEVLKKGDYATGIVGKWHLGQRHVYLPGNRGFDQYLGIPFSDDMGNARASPCSDKDVRSCSSSSCELNGKNLSTALDQYRDMGYVLPDALENVEDPGAALLPLVHQSNGSTHVLEQPLDFTHLGEKYNAFAVNFIHENKDRPFFLYVPFSHVHTTAGNQPEKQYAGCPFKNTTARGPFGDALAEVDWMVGNIHNAVVDAGIEKNTLILFSSDNGPWLIQGLSGGSTGLFAGTFSGHWNIGKGSTWEGGIREPAFAYWKGQIKPLSRTSEVMSSMDLLPTLATLANLPLPADRVYDGRDMGDILFDKGPSRHKFLFFYGGCMQQLIEKGPAAVRYGPWKAHWCTGPGIGGGFPVKFYNASTPLLFRIDKDPAESSPVNPSGGLPQDPEAKRALAEIYEAYLVERQTFVYGHLVPEPDEPGEGPDRYAVCCDRAKACDCNGPPSTAEHLLSV